MASTDPRRRNLLVMAGIAVVALLAALLTVWHQSTSTERSEPVAFFPGFAHHVAHHDATHIHIESKAGGVIDVVFRPQSGGWVIASRGGYPASFDQVNGTLVGLAAMQTIEPKTSRPEWLSYVGLDAPPKGAGTLITVTDEHGAVLASLIAGKTTDIGDPTGATGLFARKPGSNQSWLVRAVAEIRSSPSDWMEKTVIPVDHAQIQEADMQAISGPSYSVHRDKPSDADFTLTPIPAGREISDATAPDNVASAIVGFSFDDVKRAMGMDFSQATKLVTKTFEGLSVTVSTIKIGTEYWATVAASAAPDKPLAVKEANAINAKAAGWAYKLADFKGAQFTTPLENLLKPKAPAAKTGP
jgi:hypothetical protein